MSKATDLDYLLDLRERTEREMADICDQMVALPTKGMEDSVEILHDGYFAAKARLAKINDRIEKQGAE